MLRSPRHVWIISWSVFLGLDVNVGVNVDADVDVDADGMSIATENDDGSR